MQVLAWSYWLAILGAVPGMEAIDATQGDDSLDFSELDTCHGMVHVGVVFGQREELPAGVEEVIFGEPFPSRALTLDIIDDLLGLEGRAVDTWRDFATGHVQFVSGQ